MMPGRSGEGGSSGEAEEVDKERSIREKAFQLPLSLFVSAPPHSLLFFPFPFSPFPAIASAKE